MEATTQQDCIAQLRKRLDELHDAIRLAALEGNIPRDVQLTLQACRLRRRLIQAQDPLLSFQE